MESGWTRLEPCRLAGLWLFEKTFSRCIGALPSCLDPGETCWATIGLIEPESKSSGLIRPVWCVAEVIGSVPGLSSRLGLGRVYRATTGLTEPESESSGLIEPVSDFAERWDNVRLHWSMSAGFGA